MKYHAQTMVQKIAVTLDPNTVAELDRWVREGRYPIEAGRSSPLSITLPRGISGIVWCWN
jgi:hypothetical protein